MSTNSERTSFDLLQNPFLSLSIPLTWTAQQISEHLGDHQADSSVSAYAINVARQHLLTPRLRLAAELASLPDTEFDAWKTIVAALRSSQDANKLVAAFKLVPPLSKSNLLAHLSAKKGADISTVSHWLELQELMDEVEVYESLRRARDIAGFSALNKSNFKNELNLLREQQISAILQGHIDSSAAATSIEACLVPGALASPKGLQAISLMVSEYRKQVEPELWNRREKIRDNIKSLLAGPANDGNKQALCNAISSWNLISRPLQAFEQAKGREDPVVRDVYFEIRGCILNLANENNDLEAALDVARFCRSVFSNLPRTVERIEQDITELTQTVGFGKIGPLLEVIKRSQERLPRLASQIAVQGFKGSRARETKELYEKLVETIMATKGSASADLPFLAVRGIAIQIVNDFGNPSAAEKIVEDLIVLAKVHNAPAEVLDKLQVDLESLSDAKENVELLEHVTKGRTKNAINAVDKLLLKEKNQENREALTKVRTNLELKKNNNRVAYIVWGIVAVIVLVAFVVRDEKAPSLPDLTEARPATGKGLTLNRSELRYCTFQKARLQHGQANASTATQIRRLNNLIDEYNPRCSDFRYHTSDEKIITKQLLQERPRLNMEAISLIGR